MQKLDTSKWQRFRVKDIFKTVKRKKKLYVPTGANVAKNKLREDGKTPRISVTGINNGIIGYYDCENKNDNNYRVYNNFISVSFLGTVFYQEADASLEMKVHCLKPQSVVLNKYTALFLVSAIKASLKKSSYSDQISSSVLPELNINLPVNSNNKPDWKFMESYMKNIENKVKDRMLL